MWTVDKVHRGFELNRERVPADVRTALVSWYTGQGTPADEKTGVALVQRLKLYDRWLGCDCLGDQMPPPLLSPAYLSEAQTYYLRRLTADNRPAHRDDCPFHRDQVFPGNRRADIPARTVPDGYFAVLKPMAERLAQQPGDTDEREPGRVAIPRLARLLWTLIERAGTNVIEPIDGRPAPSIKHEFAKLRTAAHQFEIAPGISLAKLLITHPGELHNRAIYARLHTAAERWPDSSVPQAFLLAYATSVTTHEIRFSTGEPVLVANGIDKPAARLIDSGPYLVLVAIGALGAARGYAPVKAYAQPVQNGHHFVPVDTAAQRATLALLLQLQWSLRDARIATRLKRPLFDVATDIGDRCPDFLIESYHRREQRQTLQLLEIGNTDPGPAPASITGTPLDGIIRVAADVADHPDTAGRALSEQLRRLPLQATLPPRATTVNDEPIARSAAAR